MFQVKLVEKSEKIIYNKKCKGTNFVAKNKIRGECKNEI